MTFQIFLLTVLTNRAPRPQMENHTTNEPQPTVLNPTAVPNQEPEVTPIQQQPSSIPPENPLVNPNISLLTGNQPQVRKKHSKSQN